MLENVDNLQLVSTVELLLADPIEVLDCDLRSRARAGDI
jgi:hypothetical protein